MKPPESDLLTFIDLLDLDEEVIDRRLMPLMVRKTFSAKHLSNAKYLMKYKLLINVQEGTECENCDERLYDQFMVNLLAELNDDNIDNVCEIFNLVLSLFPSNLASKSEHLLQQILSDVQCNGSTINERNEEEIGTKILLKLKVCDSILKAVIKSGVKVSLLFLETPLEEILGLSTDQLKNHFLMKTVPLLFEGLLGYNILDRIWNYCQKLNKEKNYTALKVLSCLSGYYLPVADKDGQMKYASEIIFQTKFWEIILLGMSSSNFSNRRVSLYLAKRSMDCIVTIKRNIKVYNETGNIILLWDAKKETEYKNMWDSYFVLIESLEEKQSNIVLPSLQLFEVVKNIGREWLNCAFAIGLKHDNAQVKQKCIIYRIETKIQTEPEAQMLMQALNDISLFDKQEDIELNLDHLKLLCSDMNYFPIILKAIPQVNWSPVPLYYLSLLIGKKIIIDNNVLYLKMGSSKISSIFCDILKIPCNNLIIRRAAQRHFISFFVCYCKDIDAKDLFSIQSSLQIDIFDSDIQVEEIKYSMSSCVNDYITNNELFYELIVTSYTNIDLIVEYIKNRQCINEYYAEIKAKIAKVDNVVSRQYSKKSECTNEFIYLTSLYGDIKHMLKIHGHVSEIPMIIYRIIKKEIKPLFQYISSLLLDDTLLNDDINLCRSCNSLFYYAGSHPNFGDAKHEVNCYGDFYSEFGDEDIQEIIQQIYSMCLAALHNNRGRLQNKVFAMNILKMLLCNHVLNTDNGNEIINITDFIKMASSLQNQKEKENKGRLQNKFYATSCEILDVLIKNKEVCSNINEILSFIDKVTECGGYGCLKWILKVMNKLLPVIEENKIKYDITQFIHKMWRETEELKSNNQYAICIDEFIALITHDFLLKTSKYNNLILHYSKTIIEYGSVSITPLISLVQSIGKKELISELGQVVYVLQEILLFAPVLRKDQRILENTLLKIENEIEEFKEVHFKDWKKDDPKIHHCSSYTVQYLAVATLLKIKDPEIFKTIVDLMMKRIDELFKNKQRYHANSHHHRVLLSAVQHMLFILLLQPKSVDGKKMTQWCSELLAKLPHQPIVRMYLEWYIALYYCGKEPALIKKILENKSFTNLPQLSQLVIAYHVMKHRLSEGCNRDEFEFVMDFLLSHTMGPMFNIRLHAQYLALQLYSKGENAIKSKYHLIMNIIKQNFETCSQEKNYLKLKEDFYINTFNVSSCLVPFCIYYFLPCLYDYSNNAPELLPTTDECIEYIEENSSYITANYPSCHENSWDMDYLDKVKHDKCEVNEMLESSGTIQKKYIPWRNMNDIDVYESIKKKENLSDLIVVASLIDKLPNLGGMARTSEVFGVKTYVVDSLRHLQDKQFQGLSVSAERWVDIEEVRPGKPLKDYLMMKKTEGYSIVAAEQTSNSVPLQGFKFPKKTLLLLGHEKEGVPCDLLPLMDSCVEIPQQGFVRSLNVHVTAAIFVWEYTRQNIL